jgi:hypothetical protein
MVWVHVGLATVTWITIVWAVAAAGRLVPRGAIVTAGGDLEHQQIRELETAGRTAWPSSN